MGANMILTIGAILLFGVFLNSSNKLMIGNNQIAAQNEYYVTALSLGQSVIDEAKMKAFDEKIIGIPLGSAKVDTMTAVGSMGTDKPAEVAANPDVAGASGFQSAIKFNDVDDYNGYRRLVNTPRAEGYYVSARVFYVNAVNPDVVSGTKTFCKKMNVNVWSKYIPDTLKLSYAFTY
jgi:hypothetical protein